MTALSPKQLLSSAIFYGVLAYVGLAGIGLSYRGLRFLGNYQTAKATVVDCQRAFHQLREFANFDYRIETDLLDFPITRIERATVGFWDAIRFREPKPDNDWCALVGEAISVFYYEKLRVAIPFRRTDPEPGKLRLFYAVLEMELGGNVWMAPVGAVLVVGATVMAGLRFLARAVCSLDLRVQRQSSMSLGAFALRYLNRCIGVFVAMVLMSLFEVGLGLALVRGMLYVESSSSVLSGAMAFLGVGIASFGPGMTFRGVHWLRSTRSEFVVLVRNLVFISGLGKLTWETWAFATRRDLEELSMDSVSELMAKIVVSVFS